MTDARDGVVEAARAILDVQNEYPHKDDLRYTYVQSSQLRALRGALAALDETPEQRVVRCARAWFEEDLTCKGFAAHNALRAAVRALPEAGDE